MAEAHEEGIVEPELAMDAGDVVGRREIAGDNGRGIARRQIEQREHEERHEGHDEDGGDETADDVSEHALGRPRVRWTRHKIIIAVPAKAGTQSFRSPSLALVPRLRGEGGCGWFHRAIPKR